MVLAGIRISDALVLELATILRHDHFHGTAELLQAAVATHANTVNLDIADREHILRALEDAPEWFEDLRTTLLEQRAWMRAEGLGQPFQTEAAWGKSACGAESPL